MKRSFLSVVLLTSLLLFGMVPVAGATTTVSGTITTDTTWTAEEGPYVLVDTVTVNAGVTLTIQAGTVVKFYGTSLIVNGNLTATGASGSKVYFTDYRDDTIGGDTNGDGDASSPAPGAWLVLINDGGTAALDYSELRYGGYYNNGSYYAAITKQGSGSLSLTNSTVKQVLSWGTHIRNSASNHTISKSTIVDSGAGVRLEGVSGTTTISNNTINNNGSDGVRLEGGSGTTSISGNTITGNGGYGVYCDTVAMTLQSNALSGNAQGSVRTVAGNLAAMSGNTMDRVILDGGAITQNTTLSPLPVYVINSTVTVNAGVTLKVPAGTVVKLTGQLKVIGALSATGTSGYKVYFTDYRDDTIGGDTNGDGSASAPAVGDIRIYIEGSGQATLEYTVIRYGGYGINQQGSGSLTLNNSTIVNNGTGVGFDSSGNLTISNTTISNNSGAGIVLNTSGSITVSGSNITGNGGTGFYLRTGNLAFQNNTVTGNGGYGFWSDSSTPPTLMSGNTVTGNTPVAFRFSADWLALLPGNTYSGRIEIIGGTISQNTTLNGSILYVVSGSITVNSSATLTVPAGTVIKFDGGFTVYGALIATGISGNKVYFTDYRDDTVGGDTNGDGSSSSPTGWGYIVIQGSGSATVEHAVVRYGGFYQDGSGVVNLANTSITDGSGVSFRNGSSNHMITNCTISNNSNSGVFLWYASGTITITGTIITNNNGDGVTRNLYGSPKLVFQNNTVTGNLYWGLNIVGATLLAPVTGNTVTGNGSGALSLSADSLAAIQPSNTISGKVYIQGGTISQNATLSSGMSYIVSGVITVNSGSTLTALAGSVVKFDGGTLSIQGALVASGTSSNKVYFTYLADDTVGGDTNGDGSASVPGAGGWSGIYIEGSGQATLEYTVVSYGNIGISHSGSGSLTLSKTSIINNQREGVAFASSGNLTITNSTISNNGSSGIWLNTSGATTISGSSITGNGGYGFYVLSTTLTLMSGNTVTGNTLGAFFLPAEWLSFLPGNTISGRINIWGGIISQNTTLSAGMSYVVSGAITVNSNVTLTVPAGTIIKFGGGGLTVNGTLAVTGTSGNEVYFTDYRDDTIGGDTNGDGSSTTPTGWGYIVIQGSGSATVEHAVVRYGGFYQDGSGVVTLANTSITNGSGVSFRNGSGNHTITNCTVSNNSEGINCINATGTITITGTTISGNNGHGVFCHSQAKLVFQNNTVTGNLYWGLDIVGATLQATVTGNTVTGNGSGAFSLKADNLAFLSGNTIGGWVFIQGGTISQNTTLIPGIQYVATYYIVDVWNGVIESITVSSGATLTMPAGTVVKFEGGHSKLVVQGSLVASGTSSNKVYLTSLADDTVGGDTNGDGTATAPASGSWMNIDIAEGGSASLNYTEVRYGGLYPKGWWVQESYPIPSVSKVGSGSLNFTNSAVKNGFGIGVQIQNSGTNHSLNNSTIRDNGGDGINISSVTGTINLIGATITGNAGSGASLSAATGAVNVIGSTITGNGGYGLYCPSPTLKLQTSTLTGNPLGSVRTVADALAVMTGNTLERVILDGGTISKNTTLSAVPLYVVNSAVSINSGAALTVPAGTKAKFSAGGGLFVNGTLNATGTNGSPIYFTDYRDDTVGGDTNADGSASLPGAGGWKNIEVADCGTASLSYCTVRYGGAGGVPLISKSGAGNLTLSSVTLSTGAGDGVSVQNSSSSHAISNSLVFGNGGNGFTFSTLTGGATVTGSTIKYNAGSGISLTATNATIQGNTVNANNIGIYTAGGANPVIGGSPSGSNNIFRNTLYGVQNSDPSVQVNATSNWWGSASGPYHATLNPSGTGNPVSDNVNFGNYLAIPSPAIPIAQVAPDSHTYRHVAVGVTSPAKTFTVTNTGNNSLVMGAITLDGTDKGDFHITSDTCSGQTLAGAGTCSLAVTFAPAAKGPRLAQLRVPSNDAVNPLQTVSLSGYGAAPLPFTDGFDATVSPYWSVLNENPSLYNLTEAPGYLGIYTDFGDLWDSFVDAQNIFALPIPSGLDKLMVTAKLTFTDLPASNYQQGGIALFAESNNQPDLVNHVRAQYGYLNDAVRFQTATDTNGVSASTDGQAIASPENTVWLRLIKRGNSYQTLSSTDGFSFTLLTTVTGAWDIAYAGLFAMNGYAAAANLPVEFDFFTTVALPTIGVYPTAVPFGSATVGTTTPAQNVTISNNGPGELIVNGLTRSGSDAAMFSVGQGTCGPLPFTVLPQGSCDITVSYAPTAAGSHTATLNVANNDIDNPSVPVALSGTGALHDSLTVTKTGTGDGSINSDPSGVICTGKTCAGLFAKGTPVTLFASPDGDSILGAWSGACSGCIGETCKVTVNGVTTCGIVITFVKPARIGIVDYDTLQAAYDAAADGATILARQYTFTTGLNCNLVKKVTIKGGYNQTYTSQTGYSTITGLMTIGKGSVTTDRLQVK